MDAVGDDLGATVGNIISCSYKLMGRTKTLEQYSLMDNGDIRLNEPERKE